MKTKINKTARNRADGNCNLYFRLSAFAVIIFFGLGKGSDTFTGARKFFYAKFNTEKI